MNATVKMPAGLRQVPASSGSNLMVLVARSYPMNDEQLLAAARHQQQIVGARWVPQPPPPAPVDPVTARLIAAREEQKKAAATARFAVLREKSKGMPRRRKPKPKLDRVSSRPLKSIAGQRTGTQAPLAGQPSHNDSPAIPHPRKPASDALTARLAGMALDGVYTAAAQELGVAEADLRAKYGHLNPGLQRMNLGNRLRTARAVRGAQPGEPMNGT